MSNQRILTASMLAATVVYAAPVANSQTAAGAQANNLGSNVQRTYRAADLKTHYGILDISVGDIWVINAPDVIVDWMTSKDKVVSVRKEGNRVFIGAIASSGSYPLLIITEDATYYFQIRLSGNRGGNMREVIIQPDFTNGEDALPAQPAPVVTPTGQKPTQNSTASIGRPLPAAPAIGNAGRQGGTPLSVQAARTPTPRPTLAAASTLQPTSAPMPSAQSAVSNAAPTKPASTATGTPRPPTVTAIPSDQPITYMPPAPVPVSVPVVQVKNAASRPVPMVGRHGVTTPVPVPTPTVSAASLTPSAPASAATKPDTAHSAPAPAAPIQARSSSAVTAAMRPLGRGTALAPASNSQARTQARPVPAPAAPKVELQFALAKRPQPSSAEASAQTSAVRAFNVADIPALPVSTATVNPTASPAVASPISAQPAPHAATPPANEPAPSMPVEPAPSASAPSPAPALSFEAQEAAQLPEVTSQSIDATISFKALTNGSLTMLYYRVTNNGREQITFNEQALNLTDSKGNAIEFIAYNDTIKVAPGATYRGHVAITSTTGDTIMASLLTRSLNGLITARTSSSVALEAVN